MDNIILTFAIAAAISIVFFKIALDCGERCHQWGGSVKRYKWAEMGKTALVIAFLALMVALVSLMQITLCALSTGGPLCG